MATIIKTIRIILLPISYLWGVITWIRRWMYRNGIIQRHSGVLPSMVVGNISAGGTGKTPFVIWLSGKMTTKKPAILSRGYGRKTQGFLAVTQNSTAQEVGDEPCEIFNAVGNTTQNFVCENRLQGIQKIKELGGANLVLLDDGFQHLALQANAYVLLCNYRQPFYADLPIPTGELREFASAASQATAIVVTKCPENMEMAEAEKSKVALGKYKVPVYFAAYLQSAAKTKLGEELETGAAVVLVSALAHNTAFKSDVEKNYMVLESFAYSDHYAFKQTDVEHWETLVKTTGARGIVTSRKDATRMQHLRIGVPVFEVCTEVNVLFDGEKELIELLLKKIG